MFGNLAQKNMIWDVRPTFKPNVGNSSTQVVMPLSRYASQNKSIQLNWVSTVPGKITIIFDNSYSRFRAKTMKYRLKVISTNIS